MLARGLGATDLNVALGGRGLGMVKKTGIVRSIMARPDFLEHYIGHSLAFIPFLMCSD